MKKFGLIGYPLGHSFSRNFFNEKFQSENIDAEYVNFEIPTIEDFPQVIVSNPTLEGLNVTIPYKQAVIPYLYYISDTAKKIGAVNTVVNKNGKEVMELLTELNKEGTTIVMVTHSQHDSGYAGRTINLFDGQVVNEIKI